MTLPTETVIPLSKRKILLLVLAACGFVLLGAVFLSLDDGAIRSYGGFDPVLVRGLGLVTVVCFGAAGLYGVRRLFDPRPGLVLNGSGVVDHSSAVSAGLIPWSDIVGAEVVEIHQQKMLVIQVRDPEAYARNARGLKRALHRANLRMFGSPVVIASTALKIEFAVLVETFHRYREAYGPVELSA